MTQQIAQTALAQPTNTAGTTAGDTRGTLAATGHLGAAHGTALYVGAVLGTGVIALPALAADVAGPASLVAWIGLVVLSAPLAATFAALGARYPDAGGVATYARLAFGRRAASVVGWCFYFAVPPGGVVAALFAGDYVCAAVGGGRVVGAGTAAAVLAAVAVTNSVGVRLSGRVQLIFAGLLVLLLVGSVATSLPHARLDNLTPFAPHGWLAVGPAAALLVWSFVGWEAITHLTGEFHHPRRDVPRATAAAVVVVGVLYLAVAVTIIAVLGRAAAHSAAPLGELMATGFGGNARLLAAVAALLLTYGAMNAYYASAAKLGAALGRDGALPAWLSRGNPTGEVPRRSLGVVVGLSLLTLGAIVAAEAHVRPLVLITTASFVAVYAIGVAAALRLLPRRSKARAAARWASVAVIVLLLVSGIYLLWPAVVTVGALLYRRRSRPNLRCAGSGDVVKCAIAPYPGRGERGEEVRCARSCGRSLVWRASMRSSSPGGWASISCD